MTWLELEKCFNRALAYSFSKKKVLLVFPVLFLCGLLAIFCRALAFDASEWIAMSLGFLPILLSAGLLLSLGVLLVRIHHHEVKMLTLPMRRLFSGSVHVILGTLYLSLPPILVYLMLWVVLGIFSLLCEIPGIGDFFRVVLSFAPFLLILGSLLLCMFNLALLFFVAPAVATESVKRTGIAERVVHVLKGQVFTGIVLFLVALLPLLFVVGLLCFAAMLTNANFLNAEQCLSVALQWFFIMVPFSALLTPAVLFFFNFAAESYWLLQTKVTKAV